MSVGTEWFDRKWAEPDPWRLESTWYEDRKRAVLLASLPEEDLGEVVEVGCGSGLLTVALAARAERVVALDVAAEAVRRAHERVAAAGLAGRVRLVHGRAPQDLPSTPADTVVVSEVGYFLSPADLAALIDAATSVLRPGGTLVACHWLHEVAEGPVQGAAVQRAFRDAPGLVPLARHDEEDFGLDVLVRTDATGAGAGSVAYRQGLLDAAG